MFFSPRARYVRKIELEVAHRENAYFYKENVYFYKEINKKMVVQLKPANADEQGGGRVCVDFRGRMRFLVEHNCRKNSVRTKSILLAHGTSTYVYFP